MIKIFGNLGHRSDGISLSMRRLRFSYYESPNYGLTVVMKMKWEVNCRGAGDDGLGVGRAGTSSEYGGKVEQLKVSPYGYLHRSGNRNKPIQCFESLSCLVNVPSPTSLVNDFIQFLQMVH